MEILAFVACVTTGTDNPMSVTIVVVPLPITTLPIIFQMAPVAVVDLAACVMAVVANNECLGTCLVGFHLTLVPGYLCL
jgi:hypothetical protein